jgi:hypothetical protein
MVYLRLIHRKTNNLQNIFVGMTSAPGRSTAAPTTELAHASSVSPDFPGQPDREQLAQGARVFASSGSSTKINPGVERTRLHALRRII